MSNENNHNHGIIKPIDIAEEVRRDFLEYAMSVIVSRALPNLKDGLKPVHRRIIYAMNDLGITADKPHKKSARIVGEVIGKYHPHGDSAVYETMVRMAQDFSYRYPLIDGHGNFGSIDGDGAAAMRYTEARLSKVSNYIIKDIKMDTVPYIDNYDASEIEPAYLTGYFPNLLANGSVGIAVGMATSIPPHNLKELVSGINAYIDNNDITIDELILNHIKGPDFPTGALMTNGQLMNQGYKTGRGSVKIRAKISEEEKCKNKRLVISEIPYQTNKTKIIESIVELIKKKTIDGISDIRDESNYKGIRVVIELKKNANSDVILSKLYKFTQLQTSYSINLLSIHNEIPALLDLKSIIKHYVAYQISIIVKRSIFEKNKSEDKLNVLKGLDKAYDIIDEIINLIKLSNNDAEIKSNLISKYDFNEKQAEAIMELKLKRLSRLDRNKLISEIDELKSKLIKLNNLISETDEQNKVLKEQLNFISEKFGDDRRTEIISDEVLNIEDEELIPNLKSMISLSKEGYIRRLDPEEFRIQKRGGRGVNINPSSNEDSITMVNMGKLRDWVMFFTNSGKVFRTKMYNIKQYSRTSRGIPIINFLTDLTEEDKITTILPFKNDKNKFKYLTFITKKGIIKRTLVEEFDRVNKNGKKAITLKEDELVSVIPTMDDGTIFIATKNGKVIRIDGTIVRSSSRSSMGVKGIKLDENDYVVGSTYSYGVQNITTLSSNGYCKKSDVSNYKISGRNGKGIKVMNLNEKTGLFTSIISARETDLLLIISSDGNLIKTKVSNLPTLSRTASGVRSIRLSDGNQIQAVALEYNKNNEIDDEIE